MQLNFTENKIADDKTLTNDKANSDAKASNEKEYSVGCFNFGEKKSHEPVYIVGPTASGKSDLAFKLAKICGGVIISADSMQIYKGLNIGTAKDSVEKMQDVEYRLIDILPPTGEYSVAQFAVDAKKCIDDALKEGKLPIVVGGTGLYFEALLYPLSFSSTSSNADLRAELDAELKEYGAEYMHERLKMLDPKTAERLHTNDTKRILRALEIVIDSGKPMSENVDTRPQPDVIMVGLNTDRAKLYEKINLRVDKMFECGLVDEVFSVGRFDCQSMQAIGYKEFRDCPHSVLEADGKVKTIISPEIIESIKEKIKQDTRNYAKRQLTWFRRYPFVKWFDCEEKDAALNYLLEQIEVRRIESESK